MKNYFLLIKNPHNGDIDNICVKAKSVNWIQKYIYSITNGERIAIVTKVLYVEEVVEEDDEE